MYAIQSMVKFVQGSNKFGVVHENTYAALMVMRIMARGGKNEGREMLESERSNSYERCLKNT